MGTQVRAILAQEVLERSKQQLVCVFVSVNGSHKHLSTEVLLLSEEFL